MTREETIEAIKVMQAFVDGKLLEYRYKGRSWFPEGYPSWNFESCEYRIANQPMERFYVVAENGFIAYDCDNRSRAENICAEANIERSSHRVVHMRELLDELRELNESKS